MKFMLDLNLFFRSCDHEFLHELINFLRADVYILNRIKFSEMIKKRAILIKRHVLNDLDSETKISLTLDCWFSASHLSFLEVIIYFIDEQWQYREILLAFRSLHERHIDEKLAKEILIIFFEYSMKEWLQIITANNVTNNKTLRHHLFKFLHRRDIKWNFHMTIVNCITHVM